MAKWGSSLGVRLPKAVIDEIELKPGDRMTVSVNRYGKTILSPIRKKVSLDGLLRQISPETRHGELPWGDPAGKESW